MQVFREDPYKVYRAIWLVLGFSLAGICFLIFIQKTALDFQDWALGAALVIGLVLALFASYKWQYLAINGECLLIARVLWKETVSIRQISSLSYEFTGRALMLFVHYEKEGTQKWKGFVVDYMSTDNIKALHEGVLAVNPQVEIKTDKLSEEAQERNAKKRRQIPTTIGGRIMFALKWFGIGAAFQLILFFALAPRK